MIYFTKNPTFKQKILVSLRAIDHGDNSMEIRSEHIPTVCIMLQREKNSRIPTIIGVFQRHNLELC